MSHREDEQCVEDCKCKAHIPRHETEDEAWKESKFQISKAEVKRDEERYLTEKEERILKMAHGKKTRR